MLKQCFEALLKDVKFGGIDYGMVGKPVVFFTLTVTVIGPNTQLILITYDDDDIGDGAIAKDDALGQVHQLFAFE